MAEFPTLTEQQIIALEEAESRGIKFPLTPQEAESLSAAGLARIQAIARIRGLAPSGSASISFQSFLAAQFRNQKTQQLSNEVIPLLNNLISSYQNNPEQLENLISSTDRELNNFLSREIPFDDLRSSAVSSADSLYSRLRSIQAQNLLSAQRLAALKAESLRIEAEKQARLRALEQQKLLEEQRRKETLALVERQRIERLQKQFLITGRDEELPGLRGVRKPKEFLAEELIRQRARPMIVKAKPLVSASIETPSRVDLDQLKSISRGLEILASRGLPLQVISKGKTKIVSPLSALRKINTEIQSREKPELIFEKARKEAVKPFEEIIKPLKKIVEIPAVAPMIKIKIDENQLGKALREFGEVSSKNILKEIGTIKKDVSNNLINLSKKIYNELRQPIIKSRLNVPIIKTEINKEENFRKSYDDLVDSFIALKITNPDQIKLLFPEKKPLSKVQQDFTNVVKIAADAVIDETKKIIERRKLIIAERRQQLLKNQESERKEIINDFNKDFNQILDKSKNPQQLLMNVYDYNKEKLGETLKTTQFNALIQERLRNELRTENKALLKKWYIDYRDTSFISQEDINAMESPLLKEAMITSNNLLKNQKTLSELKFRISQNPNIKTEAVDNEISELQNSIIINRVKKTALDLASFGRRGITNPLSTAGEFIAGTVMFAPNLAQRYLFTDEAAKDPTVLLEDVVNAYVFSKALNVAKKLPSKIYEQQVKELSPAVSAEKVFAKETITKVGENKYNLKPKVLPKSDSPEAIIKSFNEKKKGSYTYVVHTTATDLHKQLSDGKLALLPKEVIQKVFNLKQTKGEDPLVYGTTEGRASAHFTRIDEFGEKSERWSIDPSTLLTTPFFKKTGTPSVLRMVTKEAEKFPQSVIKIPGYEVVTKYTESPVKPLTTAFVTKRRTLGKTSEEELGIRPKTILELKDLKHTELNGVPINILTMDMIGFDPLIANIKTPRDIKLYTEGKVLGWQNLRGGINDLKSLPKGLQSEANAYLEAVKPFFLEDLPSKNVNLGLAKEPPKNSVRIIDNILRRNKKELSLGGSNVVKSYFEKIDLVPGDWDFYAPRLQIFKYNNLIFDSFKKNNVDFSFKKGAFYNKSGKKFLEIHSMEDFLSPQVQEQIIQTKGKIIGKTLFKDFVRDKKYLKFSSNGYSIIDPTILAYNWLIGAFKKVKTGKAPRFKKDLPRFIQVAKQLLTDKLREAESKPDFIKQLREYEVYKAIKYLDPFMERLKNAKPTQELGLKFKPPTFIDILREVSIPKFLRNELGQISLVKLKRLTDKFEKDKVAYEIVEAQENAGIDLMKSKDFYMDLYFKDRSSRSNKLKNEFTKLYIFPQTSLSDVYAKSNLEESSRKLLERRPLKEIVGSRRGISRVDERRVGRGFIGGRPVGERIGERPIIERITGIEEGRRPLPSIERIIPVGEERRIIPEIQREISPVIKRKIPSVVGKPEFKELRAWRPVFTERTRGAITGAFKKRPLKKLIRGDFFRSKAEAEVQGVEETDASKNFEFSLETKRVLEPEIKRGKDVTGRGFKFIKKGNIYIERNRYRRDRPFEWKRIVLGRRFE